MALQQYRSAVRLACQLLRAWPSLWVGPVCTACPPEGTLLPGTSGAVMAEGLGEVDRVKPLKQKLPLACGVDQLPLLCTRAEAASCRSRDTGKEGAMAGSYKQECPWNCGRLLWNHSLGAGRTSDLNRLELLPQPEASPLHPRLGSSHPAGNRPTPLPKAALLESFPVWSARMCLPLAHPPVLGLPSASWQP